MQTEALLPGIQEATSYYCLLGHRPNWAVVYGPDGTAIERYEGFACHQMAAAFVAGANVAHARATRREKHNQQSKEA